MSITGPTALRCWSQVTASERNQQTVIHFIDHTLVEPGE